MLPDVPASFSVSVDRLVCSPAPRCSFSHTWPSQKVVMLLLFTLLTWQSCMCPTLNFEKLTECFIFLKGVLDGVQLKIKFRTPLKPMEHTVKYAGAQMGHRESCRSSSWNSLKVTEVTWIEAVVKKSATLRKSFLDDSEGEKTPNLP